MNNISKTIKGLIYYAELNLNVNKMNSIYLENILMNELQVVEPYEGKIDKKMIKTFDRPDYFYKEIFNYLVQDKDFYEKEADLLINKLFGTLTERPNEINKRFLKLEKKNSDDALDYLYNLSILNNYVAKSKIEKNLMWTASFNEGNDLEVTINLSKPEKSNADIANLLKKTTTSSYPKCLLCYENLGFGGNEKKDSRVNIRFIPIKLNNNQWYLQYSPYGYFNKHCIVFSKNHSNMVINSDTFNNLCLFVDRFPSFFVGSNADLPIVGGSILNHEHYQGGEHLLPIFKCKTTIKIPSSKFEKVDIYLTDWYNSAILLKSNSRSELVGCANEILKTWRDYTDEENDILASTNNENHNTITPAIRKVDDTYYLYLILRNNRCNEEFEGGIFHAHPQYHNIKKEGIGIIEAMGLFILPARLIRQFNQIKDSLNEGKTYYEALQKFGDLTGFEECYAFLEKDFKISDYDEKVKEYINNVCKNILKNTAVFKENEKGKIGFIKFLESVNL